MQKILMLAENFTTLKSEKTVKLFQNKSYIKFDKKLFTLKSLQLPNSAIKHYGNTRQRSFWT